MKMEKKYFVFLLSLILLLVSFSFPKAQDPGLPDTVRFEAWGTYVPCPPCSGEAVVPMYIFNDESLMWIKLVFGWSGVITCDSVWFSGDIRMSFFTQQGYSIRKEDKVILMGGGTLDPENPIPPGLGIMAYLHFVVEDTGLASVFGTCTPIEEITEFTIHSTHFFRPLILTSEFCIQPQAGSPGDVNDDGIVNLSDVIYLTRYLFRGGPEPVYMPSADVNTDCQVNITDAIIIAKWYFFRWVGLQPGCAY